MLCGMGSYALKRFSFLVCTVLHQPVCLHVDSEFTQNGHLQTHILRHVGVKPYVCSECPKHVCTCHKKGLIQSHTSWMRHIEDIQSSNMPYTGRVFLIRCA